MKRVLILTDWYEPGFKAGGPIQSCKNLVREFSDLYEFYILTSDRDIGDDMPYQNILTNRWIKIGANLQVYYIKSDMLSSSCFYRIVKFVSPDTVYLNSMFSTRFTILPLLTLLLKKVQTRIVLAPRGMLQQGAMARKTLKKELFLNISSFLGLMKKVTFHATNAGEKLEIENFFKQNAGIVEAENIPERDLTVWQPRAKYKHQLKCIFVSRIHPKKNLRFAIKIFKEIGKDHDVLFDIYGGEDDKAYAADCKNFAKGVGSIAFKGPLNRENLFPVLRQYHLFFLPTLGENFGHAIFEALSAGCPVLISNQTYWKNVEANNAGWALDLSYGESFKEKIIEVYNMDQEEFNVKSYAARQYAESYLGEKNLRSQYQQLFG